MKKLLIILAMVMAFSTATYAQQSCVIEQPADAEDLPLKQGLPVIVDCSAVWCGPCKQFAPIFEKTAEAFKGKALFVHVDVDECPYISYNYQIRALPTLMMFDADGNLQFREAGALTEDEFLEEIHGVLGI